MCRTYDRTFLLIFFVCLFRFLLWCPALRYAICFQVSIIVVWFATRFEYILKRSYANKKTHIGRLVVHPLLHGCLLFTKDIILAN